MLPADKDPPSGKSAAEDDWGDAEDDWGDAEGGDAEDDWGDAEGGDEEDDWGDAEGGEDDWGDDADGCGMEEDYLFDLGVQGEGEAAGTGGWVTAEDDSFLHAHDVDEAHTIRQSQVGDSNPH